MTNFYTVTIRFKNNKTLQVKLETEENLVRAIFDELPMRAKWIAIGDYFISKEDILWVEVEGDRTIEERRRKQLQNIGEKVQ